MTLKKDDKLVAYSDHRPAERLFITVTRVAKDKTWADITVQTWAVGWKKRQKLDGRGLPPTSEFYDWGMSDLVEQENDHMAKLRSAPVMPNAYADVLNGNTADTDQWDAEERAAEKEGKQ